MPNNQKGFISVFMLLAEMVLLGFFLFSSSGPYKNTILSTFFPTISSHVSAQNPAPRPNIVVIMTDDLDVRTTYIALKNNLLPNLQKEIMSRGLRFNRFFVTNSLCCPSRATFLTGQYSHNHKVINNGPQGGVKALNDRSTVATWLKASGYRTGHVGKYLNGYGYMDINKDGKLDPEDRRYVPEGWDDWQGLLDQSTYKMYEYEINDNRDIFPYGTVPEHYQTDVLSKRSLDFIEESEATDDTPFFLVVAPLAPHVEILSNTSFKSYTDIWRWDIRPAPRHVGSVKLPLTANISFNEKDISDKPWELQQNRPLLTASDSAALQRQYQNRIASMRAVDDLIASVSAKLKEKGEFDNTILIFTSDNGFMYGEHRLAEKLYPYEESIFVPLYIAGPGVPVNQVTHKFVTNTDLAPTIAELANATPTHTVDGTSFVPLLADPEKDWRKRFLIEHWRGIDSIFDLSDYFAVRTSAESSVAPAQIYVEYNDTQSSKEHYNLFADPFQMQSIHNSASPSAQLQRSVLANWLTQLKACAGITCRDVEFGN